jgi:flagellar motility protein MotE (MotC chaperone)
VDDAWKRQILVSQFATLAERLGITIPSEIIGKLQQQQPAEAADQSPVTPTQPHEHIPEAMAAFTATPTTAAVAAITTSATSSSAAAAASKQQRTSPKDSSQRRRKKPRLHDCQVKLANLREENERLKRHLDVIQNRSQKILKERANTEQTLRTMMENGASDDQLAPLIDAYSEAHSDYGKKRFEELQFHLDQLQVLATPTDFTKMGLWALAGNHGLSSSTKPKISNLLQTELDITDAQSRKILEQRQKIRMVCANHKEVRTLCICVCVCLVRRMDLY